MNDLLRRTDVRDHVLQNTECITCPGLDNCWTCLNKWLDEVPAVDKESVGTWLYTGDYLNAAYDSIPYYGCSQCHASVLIEFSDEYAFCPKCGCKMQNV